ncbi:outer membrane beta-barrel protein (plasmid) [Vibrio tubiashii]|uniref:outer membrane beta-barrel protein n=1 Tax=Vibrio tubiashii TaxID=29498 RepID=UPI00234ED3C5|nr:outer membrane beta-barrel protein [Vibrio tubiashii]WCP70258.1 outer membrane beta-barrel protein [Vibrio tubiashii]
MKKKVLSVCLFLTPFAQATTSSDIYAGFELFGGQRHINEDVNNAFLTDNLDRMNGIRLHSGYYLSEQLRAYGYIQRNVTIKNTLLDSTGGQTLKYSGYQLGAGMDYRYSLTANLYGYLGVELGVLSNKIRYTALNKTHTDSRTTLVLGSKIGLGYQFTETWTVEGGLKIDRPSSDTLHVDNKSVHIRHGSAIFATINYRF